MRINHSITYSLPKVSLFLQIHLVRLSQLPGQSEEMRSIKIPAMNVFSTRGFASGPSVHCYARVKSQFSNIFDNILKEVEKDLEPNVRKE